MKDVTAKMRQAYTVKLEPLAVGVYDQVLPVNRKDTKYIILTTQTQDGNRTKSNFTPLCSIVVDINVRTGSNTGKLECDRIANEVLQLINPISRSGYIDLGEDFECVLTTVLQNETLHDLLGTGHIYRRIIRFQHKVLEK